ncbi:MAG TPA: PAS domain S-box protein [Tepidisphaeraceae bacterium]|nr:PAS domain S-box protein [Tepidisphaeraceae bacterium]
MQATRSHDTRFQYWCYLLPALTVAVAVLIRWSLHSLLLQRSQLPLFFLAIMVSGWYGGLWPALLALGLSLVAGTVFFPRPFNPGALNEIGEWVWLGFFILVGVAIAVLTEGLHRARRRAEASMQTSQESQKMLQLVLDTIPVRVFWKDRESRFLGCNRLLAQDAGLDSPQDIIGKVDSELAWKQQAELYRADDRQVIETGTAKLNYEEPQTAPDGRQLWLRTSKIPLRDVHGTIIGVLGTYEDITESKRAQEALLESEERFRNTFDHAPVGISHIDERGRWLHANQAFCNMMGYSREELLQKSFQELTYPEDLAADQAQYERLIRGEIDSYAMEKRYVRKDGQIAWMHLTRAMQRNLRTQPRYTISITQDITERKRIAEEMAQSKRAAEEANQAKDRFLAILSHELRTPLTPVLAAASALERDHRLPPDVGEELSMMRRNVELEARLIDDMLDLTGIVRGKLMLKRQLIDICTLLRHTVQTCAPEIDAKELHVAMNLSAKNRWMHADPSRLQQIFWNLISNAIKFTPAGGCIGINCQNDDQGQVVVQVSDSGIGIEAELMPRIFGAFEQGSRLLTREYGGLGLGLSIAKALAELHGGRISAHSEGRGKGATFRVVLPSVTVPDTHPAPPPSTETCPMTPPPPREHKRRVLLVEDHVDTLRIMSQLLRAYEFDVRTAGTVASAMELANTENFDLVISDLGLPDGSGLDLIRSVHERHPELRGIALSGYGMDEDIARSRQAGFMEHLTKPINFTHLQEAIARTMVS